MHIPKILCNFAAETEIEEYMRARGFFKTAEDGKYTNKEFLLWDIKPKNVLFAENCGFVVIDAEIEKL